MKKILKIAIISFLAGQASSLFYKNNNFRKKFDQAQGFDKCKLIFDELLDLNKKIFLDLREKDYKSEYEELIKKLENKRQELEIKLEELKKKTKQISNEKLLPKIDELLQKAEQLRAQAEILSEKYQVRQKVDKLISNIQSLKIKK